MSVDVEVTIRDRDDRPVVESAVAGRAEAIVTGNAHLLDDADLRDWLAERGIEVLSPGELLRRLPAA